MNKLIGFIKYLIVPAWKQINWHELMAVTGMLAMTIVIGSFLVFLLWLLGKIELAFGWHMFISEASKAYNEPYSIAAGTLLWIAILIAVGTAVWKIYKNIHNRWLDYLKTLENKS